MCISVSASMLEKPANQATVQQFPLVAPSSLYNWEAGDTPEPSGFASLVPPLRLKIPRPSGAQHSTCQHQFCPKGFGQSLEVTEWNLMDGAHLQWTSLSCSAASSPVYSWLVNKKRQRRWVAGKGEGSSKLLRTTEMQLEDSNRMRGKRKVVNLVGFYISNMPTKR